MQWRMFLSTDTTLNEPLNSILCSKISNMYTADYGPTCHLYIPMLCKSIIWYVLAQNCILYTYLIGFNIIFKIKYILDLDLMFLNCVNSVI